MNTQQPVSHRDALDIVFAHRNRAYGAYQLRRQYPCTLGKALLLTLLIFGGMLAVPRILAAFSTLTEPEEVIACEIITKINLEKTPPPVLQTPPPPPPSAAIAYTPPVVTPDEQAPDENPQDVQTILDDPRKVGAQTAEGPDEGPPALDLTGSGAGAIVTPAPADEDPKELFDVHKMPSFPGGEAEMLKWIYAHIRYPDMAREGGVQGTVVLQFVVGKDGRLTDIGVLKTPAGGNVLGKEAVRVVQAMPAWSPGEANGHPVKVRYTLPIRFALQ